ncbi:MAG: type II secretion system F family protein [Candidatus Nanohaloarchaea archaeon]
MNIDFFKEEELVQGYTLEDKVLFLSLGLGGAFLLPGIILLNVFGATQIGGMLIILGLVAGILPYALMSFLKNRAITEMEEQFPSFLNDLAESTRGGMTIIKAFESARETDYGRLNQEIEKIHNELTWGIPFPEVMERFSKRMEDSSLIQENVSIIIQSFQSGGSITNTIQAVADDAAELKEVMDEKDSQLKQQLMIMYVIFLLFIGISVVMYILLNQLLGLGSQGPGALSQLDVGTTGGAADINYCSGAYPAAEPFCTVSKVFGFIPADADMRTIQRWGKMAYYKGLLFTMLMVQGASTAAVAGQITRGKPSAGVKHALVMLPVAFVVFMIFVRTMGF